MADRSVLYRLQADVTQFRAQMGAAGAAVQDAADRMTGATREGENFRAGLTSLGETAGKVGLVAAAGLGAAVVKSADFDQAMSGVQAATHESAAAMEDLREAALQAGADTAFSATEAADGIEQLAKAGVATQDILAGGLTGALDLAAAGTIDVGVAAEIAATTMNQFGLAGTDVAHISDVLAASAGKAMGEVTDMAGALKYVGPVAAQMGISLEEAAGSIAFLASEGILGEQAGTSLRGMLTSLTSPSKAAADQMKTLGISMYDASGEFIGLDGLAGQLQASMTNLTAAERDQAFGRMFGNEQITAARILYKGGAGAIEEWTTAVNDQGYAAETAATKLDNLKGDIEALSGSFETALIGTGAGAQGPLRSLVQSLTSGVNAYNDLSDSAKTSTAVTLGGIAAIGGGLFVMTKLVSGAAAARVALTQLGVSATTAQTAMVGLSKAAGAAVGAFAGLMVIDHFTASTDKVAPGLEAMTRALTDVTSAAAGSSLPDDLDSLGESIARLTDPATLDGADDRLRDWVPGLGDSKQLKEAKMDVEALDAALANMASTAGNVEASEAALAKLIAETDTDYRIVEMLPQYKEAIAGIQNEAVRAAEATGSADAATEGLGRAATKTAEQLKVEADALEDARDAARDTATSFFNLGDGLDDAKVSLGQWIKQMANQADALNNFTANAERAADKGLRKGLIAALNEAGPAGALRMKQLANATEQEIARANGAWAKGQRAMDKYVNTTVPTKVLNADASPALRAFASVEQRLAYLDGRTARVYINTIRTGSGDRMATGGPIYGPGTATSDSIPAMLSNGEYVMKAAAVSKYGVNFFDRANSMRLAGGGSPGKAPMYGSEKWVDQLIHQLGGMEKAIKHFDKAVSRQEKALDKQSSAVSSALTGRDGVMDKMASLADATTAGFRTGLFESQKPASVWAAGARNTGGPFDNLSTDIAGLQKRAELQAQLTLAGLDRAAFESALSQGSNDDLAALIASGKIQQFEDQFNQREALFATTGAAAGQARFGGELAGAQAILDRQLIIQEAMRDEMRELNREAKAVAKEERQREARREVREERNADRTGEKVGAALNGAAAQAQRQRRSTL